MKLTQSELSPKKVSCYGACHRSLSGWDCNKCITEFGLVVLSGSTHLEMCIQTLSEQPETSGNRWLNFK